MDNLESQNQNEQPKIKLQFGLKADGRSINKFDEVHILWPSQNIWTFWKASIIFIPQQKYDSTMNQAGWPTNFYYDNGHHVQDMSSSTPGYEISNSTSREDYRGFSSNTSANYHLQGIFFYHPSTSKYQKCIILNILSGRSVNFERNERMNSFFGRKWRLQKGISKLSDL